MLVKSLSKIEKLEFFHEFVQSGVNYISENGTKGKEENNSKAIVDLPLQRVELMKDLLIDLEDIIRSLRADSKDAETFSITSD